MIASVTVAIRITDESGLKSVEVTRQSSKAREALQDALTETLSSVVGVTVPVHLPPAPEPPPVRAHAPAPGKRRRNRGDNVPSTESGV